MQTEHDYEELYEQLSSYHPITLAEVQDTSPACLEAVATLLNKHRLERSEHEARRKEANEREQHLQSSITKLSSQNALLNTRLLACLDSLDVAQYHASEDDSAQAQDALRLLNSSLSLRLRETQAENARLKEALNSATDRVRHVNDRTAIQRASLSKWQHFPVARPNNRYQAPHQDSSPGDDESDAATETQQNHDQYDRQKPRHQDSTTQPLRLRTRTVVLELTNELEMIRRSILATERQKEESVTLLQSHLESRDRELASLYGQLDQFYGLPGLALSKTLHPQADKSTLQGETSLDVLETQQLVQQLNEQVTRLKDDLAKLRTERDNLLPYAASSASFASSSQADLDENVERMAARLSYFEAENEDLRSKLAAQDAEMNDLATRVRSKLTEQKDKLETAKKEIGDLHRVLHDTELLAKESNKALQLEKERRERAERLLLHDVGHGVRDEAEVHAGTDGDKKNFMGRIRRPRSAMASPDAGSRYNRDGRSDPLRPSGLLPGDPFLHRQDAHAGPSHHHRRHASMLSSLPDTA